MPDVIRSANAFFFPYRMPTLMLMSGMLLTRSLQKPLPVYYAGKLAMVLWPHHRQDRLPRDARGAVVALARLVRDVLPVVPVLHRRVLRGGAAPEALPPWVPIALGAAAGVLLEHGSTEQRMGYFAVFFFAGSWIASSPGLVGRLARPRAAVLLGIPAIAFGAASIIWTDSLHYLVWGAPLSIAGALALVAVFARPRIDGPVTQGLQFLGRSSIVFYVSHFPIMALLSQSALAEGSFVLLAAVNLAAAILIGSVLAVYKTTRPVIWLSQAPRRLTDIVTKALGLVLPQGRTHRSPARTREDRRLQESE